MFAPLTSRRRCIIPANGWFEWVKDGGERIPFYHYHRDGEPLALAGLWTSWSGGEGDLIESFTIITSPASPQFSSVHHRMPALLGREDWQMWLDTSLSAEIAIQCVDRERVDAVSLEIDHHEVSQQVNNVANQSEDLLTAVTHH